MSELNFQSRGGVEGFADWVQLARRVKNYISPSERVRERGQIETLQLLSAGEGGVIPRLFGRMRLGGRVIWRGSVRENIFEEATHSGGKNVGSNRTRQITRDYSYLMSFAIALCEGEISHIGRIWMDGKPIERGHYEIRVHRGTTEQAPDSLIESIRGINKTPAYRGIAYVVFQDFDLTRFGNRIPQISFEVFRQAEDYASLIQGVNILPGATEFGYDPTPHIQATNPGEGVIENVHASHTESDWTVSINTLQDSLPNCKFVALVVAWFGNDLRAEKCQIAPRVEVSEKHTMPRLWSVAGLGRHQAIEVSKVNGRPAFGSTPDDESVLAALRDLKERGFKILFYPFIMMDIPQDNRLPDPSGSGYQPAFPWRGRIACTPVSDEQDSIVTQIRNFTYGADADSRKFSLYGMVDHYARLCASVEGGIDAFLIGSELRALSRQRDGSGEYPFADELVKIADHVRTILPDTQISYAADWSEYGAHVYTSGAVDFPLDKFWASSNCDFIGIDVYFPLSDWRDGVTHKDSATASSIYDLDYLESQVAGGEYYDWYYRDSEARASQTRSEITDGLNEPWLYRAKDIFNWWRNVHRPRADNIRGKRTDWRVKMKPIWFTELGCPAVEKGSNEPNVFPDAKSSEHRLPHYSTGVRDDLIQRRYLEAVYRFYGRTRNNPSSTVYKGRMVASDQIFVWAWDARPFPAFPYLENIWADNVNWETGHWLNGRVAAASLDRVISETLGDVPISPLSDVPVTVEGFVIDRVSPPRQTLEPLLEGFGVDARMDEAGMCFTHRSNLAIRDVKESDLIVSAGVPAQVSQINDTTDLPYVLKLYYYSADNEYSVSVVQARRPSDHDTNHPIAQLELPVVMSSGYAQHIVSRLLHELWGERGTLRLVLPPRFMDIETNDLIRFNNKTWRVRTLTYAQGLEVTMVRHEESLYHAQTVHVSRSSVPQRLRVIPRPYSRMFELPASIMSNGKGDWPVGVPLVAVHANPWPGVVRFESKNKQWAFDVLKPSIMGKTYTPLPWQAPGRWHHDAELNVVIYAGMLESRSDDEVLGGANRLVIESQYGWEVIQFREAHLIGKNTYRLRGLLRGVGGSGDFGQVSLSEGKYCILLDSGPCPVPLRGAQLSSALAYRYGPRALPQDTYAWQSGSFVPRRQGLIPLSPVHPSTSITSDNGWKVTWIRRARIDGDDFEAAEVPLGEEREEYFILPVVNNLPVTRFTQTSAEWIPTSRQITHLLKRYYRAREHNIKVAQVSASGVKSGYGVFDISDLFQFSRSI